MSVRVQRGVPKAVSVQLASARKKAGRGLNKLSDSAKRYYDLLEEKYAECLVFGQNGVLIHDETMRYAARRVQVPERKRGDYEAAMRLFKSSMREAYRCQRNNTVKVVNKPSGARTGRRRPGLKVA